MSPISLRSMTLTGMAALIACSSAGKVDDSTPPGSTTPPPVTTEPPTDTGDDTTTPPTDTGTPPWTGTCLTDAQLELVGAYLIEVTDRVPRLAQDAMDVEPMTFLALPGWDPIGVGFPIMWIPCAGPLMLTETCDGVACSTTECVAPGVSWIQHARLETAPMSDPAGLLTYDATHSHVSWTDQAPDDLEVELDAIAHDAYGADYSLSVVATYLSDDLNVVITFPGMLGTGEVVTAVATESWGIVAGGVAVDGVMIADLIDGPTGYSVVFNDACR